MQRDGGNELGLGNAGGAGAAVAAEAAKPGGHPSSLLATLRYGSANLLLLLGAAALIIGGWAPWVVLALALVFGSFADEVRAMTIPRSKRADARSARSIFTCRYRSSPSWLFC